MKNLGQKLKNAREFLKLSQKDIASKLGYSNYQTILYYENGRSQPSIYDLKRLSELYHKSISYFIDDAEEIDEPAIVCWRKEPIQELKFDVEARFKRLSDNYVLLEELLNIKLKNSLSNSWVINSKDDCINCAKEISTKLELGKRPANVLKKVLEEDFGVKIYELFLGNNNCSGATIKYKNSFVVLLNSAEKEWRRNFSLAHELFHILTWDSYSDNSINKNMETFADCFASVLLLPENEIRIEIESNTNKKMQIMDLVDLSIEFNVSFEAFVYRLSNLKMISPSVVDLLLNSAYMKAIKKQKYFTHEEAKDSEKISSRFERLTIKNYILGNISSGKFCELLGIKKHEIDEYLLDKGIKNKNDVIEEFELISA